MLATGSEQTLTATRTATQAAFQAPGRAFSLDDHLAHGTLRGIEAKEHLFTEGDAKAFVYKVVTGAVCLYKVLPDGRRQVIDFALPGDIIGIGWGPTETYNAQATVATRVRCIPSSSAAITLPLTNTSTTSSTCVAPSGALGGTLARMSIRFNTPAGSAFDALNTNRAYPGVEKLVDRNTPVGKPAASDAAWIVSSAGS